jgi:hypothetical protein
MHSLPEIERFVAVADGSAVGSEKAWDQNAEKYWEK